jgi:MFS family permease
VPLARSRGVYIAVSSYFATAIEVFPLHAATVSGTMNTGAGLRGIIAPILTPWIAQHFGWIAAICSAGVSSLFAAVLSKFLSSETQELQTLALIEKPNRL